MEKEEDERFYISPKNPLAREYVSTILCMGYELTCLPGYTAADGEFGETDSKGHKKRGRSLSLNSVDLIDLKPHRC